MGLDTGLTGLCRANPFLSADEIIGIYNDRQQNDSVFRFIDRESERIRELGRTRTRRDLRRGT